MFLFDNSPSLSAILILHRCTTSLPAAVMQDVAHCKTSPDVLVQLLRIRNMTLTMGVLQFGVCLWEIVTSQMPQRGEMFCPSADSCPASVISLIHECMKINPEDRPSAKEICRYVCPNATSIFIDSKPGRTTSQP